MSVMCVPGLAPGMTQRLPGLGGRDDAAAEDPICRNQPGRERAELVTDDKAALREQLEAVTGERIVALEAVDPERVKGRETALALAAGTANVSYRDVVEAANCAKIRCGRHCSATMELGPPADQRQPFRTGTELPALLQDFANVPCSPRGRG